jgi:3-dehydroquinate dehydratase
MLRALEKELRHERQEHAHIMSTRIDDLEEELHRVRQEAAHIMSTRIDDFEEVGIPEGAVWYTREVQCGLQGRY